MSITVKNVHHRYGATPVLDDVSLEVEQGQILCLLGPSGSGKSTVLKLLAGLEELQSGTITLNDQQITPANCPPPEARSVGLVFQQHALFPHLTVAGNVAFGLDALGKGERESRVRELTALVSLRGFEDRYPHTLSGGQQQRVALARALAPQPSLMLMDEPFANVDLHLSQQLREDARRSLKKHGSTTVMVTHDADEAMEVADMIAVIVDGKIVQTGTPESLWRAPHHRFVAETIRGLQLITGDAGSNGIATAFGKLPGNEGSATGAVTVAVDGSQLRLQDPGEESGGATVEDIRFVGVSYQLLLIAGDESLRLYCASLPELKRGDRVGVDFTDADRFIYN